ncbi:3-methyl-2-oxobutanoate hydroxymethyltransferase [Nocardiopsis algeriensis]|uniref:3-methyl-2-oxobutanoate hydroxymethyltransferase n=1 Tax=Nocardiopsis algeriensis TaxID=1478215 RepID=A0A841IMH2_9ACTN|nr:3-methyl-2-oxobutanoate hydroxymethyltransferase [Nocardiopsis algeriensis]MBB6119262.1 3-methyl-2-oxobutanoate hydroxymethyltransferase [Nocardiopsis algeriensis]
MSTTPTTPSAGNSLYGGVTNRRVTVRDLAAAKERGERWPMLTAYDALTSRVFDEAGIPVLLVGDSAANVVYGYETTLPVTVDELIPLTAAVTRSTKRAMVVADLPFASYQASPQQALETASRFMKEGRAQAVKLEGGRAVAPQVELLVSAGVPVMAHLGLTPQSVNTLGGYRVQGRGDEAAENLLKDAKELERAGAFAVVLECVPADLARRVTEQLAVPTVGIGAGPGTDAQVLVWQDMAGLSPKVAKFVKTYANLHETLRDAASAFAGEVVSGAFPEERHSYSA